MKLAYIILAHKNFHQVARLINTLSTPSSSFFVHVDRKAGKNFEVDLLNLVHQKSCVYFVTQQPVWWGEFSLVEATLRSMCTLLESKVDFDYVKFLTGQCYPIKPISKIHRHLEENYPFSFIEFFSLPSQYWIDGGEAGGGMDRVNYIYLHLARRSWRLPFKRRLPVPQMFGGSFLWCLTKECAEYVCRFYELNSQFFKFFKYVFIPEEIFFQTVLLHSEFKAQIINNNLSYTDWEYNAPHPTILGKPYFSTLSESSCFFARKFDCFQDEDILDLIDQKLLD